MILFATLNKDLRLVPPGTFRFL